MTLETQNAVLQHGDKVLVITRRTFKGDPRRHMVGTVERYDRAAIRVAGYVFFFDVARSIFVRRKSQRTRIFPMDNHVIINVLPSDTEISSIRYEHPTDGELFLTDGKHIRLELDEFIVGG